LQPDLDLTLHNGDGGSTDPDGDDLTVQFIDRDIDPARSEDFKPLFNHKVDRASGS
jgi:hypothetical protein